jgi:hypothetical protein
MSTSPATWLIIEPTITGHHLDYLQHIVAGAQQRGIRVVVGVGTDPAGEQIERRLRADHPRDGIEFVRTPLPAAAAGPARLAQGMLRWRRFYADTWRAARCRRRVDLVFVPYLDDAIFAVALLGSPFGDCPFAGITMRQRFHFPHVGVVSAPQRGARLRRRLFRRLLGLGTLRCLFVIDETLPEYVARCHREVASKVVFVPDPSDPPRRMDRGAARTVLGLPPSALVVLLYGYIEARKGVASMLEWAADAVPSADLHVVLAGIIDENAKAFIDGGAGARLREAGRLHVIDRYVAADEEPLLFSAVDWVWLAYQDFELMSGVLVKAAQYGRDVLFRNVGLIGRFARRYGSPTENFLGGSAGDGCLPPGVQLRQFGDRASPDAPLPDHSWDNACRIIFDGPMA